MNPPRKRPLGITLLALMFFWIGCFGTVFFPMIVASGGLADLKGVFFSGHMQSEALQTFIVSVFGLIWFLFYVAYAFIGFGLWKLRNWARRALQAVLIFGGVLSLLVMPFVKPRILILPMLLAFTLIYGWQYWYLRRPHVLFAFGLIPPAHTIISGPPPKPKRTSRWVTIGGAVALFACFLGLLTVVVDIMMRRSDIYKLVLADTRKSPCVAARIGNPFKASWFINGSLEDSTNEGSADLSFDITGNKGGGTINASAKKTKGTWNVTSLALVTDTNHSIITPGIPEICDVNP